MTQRICDYCGKSLANKHTLKRHRVTCGGIINLGKEQPTAFGKDNILDLLEGDNIIIRLFKLVNLDPDKPQYHNVFYPNSKSEYALVFRSNKWIRVNAEELCDEVIDHKIRFLENFIKEQKIDDENAREQIELLTNDVSARKNAGKQIRRILLAKKEMIKESIILLTSASVLFTSWTSDVF